MNQAECLALRDMLFANRFSTENKERVFRYLAVEPGGIGDAMATVHYAYAPAVWERAGCVADADTYLSELIDQTPYKDAQLALQYHDYLRHGWSCRWDQTAKDSINDFPTLILRESADGKVEGFLMRDPHDAGNVEVAIADGFAEPAEVEHLLLQLEDLAQHAKFMGLYLDHAIRADSLEAAIAQTPATEAGQKAVLLYRNMEWWRGLWTQGNETPISLSSVADFHGCRVSNAKRQTREGLDIVRSQQTIPGDYAVLEQAINLLPVVEVDPSVDYEAMPAIQALCRWWNAHAPASMQLAGVFRLYYWDEAELMFHPGDSEEPAVSASHMAKQQCYSVFEATGKPTVVAVFYRGRAYNQPSEWGAQTYRANGEPGWQIGLDPSEVNEAYYSFVGLRNSRYYCQQQLSEDQNEADLTAEFHRDMAADAEAEALLEDAATIWLGQVCLIVRERSLTVENGGLFWNCNAFRPETVTAHLYADTLELRDNLGGGPVGHLVIPLAGRCIEDVQAFLLVFGVDVENHVTDETHQASRPTTPAKPEPIRCDLSPSGITHTPIEVEQWAQTAATAIRGELHGTIRARLWSYRHGRTEYLACDFSDENGHRYPMTFGATGRLDLGAVDEPLVTDLAEALHMATMVIHDVGATVTTGSHSQVQPEEQDNDDIDLSDLEAKGKRIYRITHHYNIGNQDVYVEHPTGDVDGKRVALYCWYKACDWFGLGALISDLGIASVMVAFYGFRHCATHPFSTTVDLYHDAEGIGPENYQALMNDPALHRDGLREAMAPHIEGAEVPVAQTLTQPTAATFGRD